MIYKKCRTSTDIDDESNCDLEGMLNSAIDSGSAGSAFGSCKIQSDAHDKPKVPANMLETVQKRNIQGILADKRLPLADAVPPEMPDDKAKMKRKLSKTADPSPKIKLEPTSDKTCANK